MNTSKETKQVVPTKGDYFALSNCVARSAHSLSVMQARLIYLAMAQVRPNDKKLQPIEMKVGDIVRALELDNHNAYTEIRGCVTGVMSNVIRIDTGNGWKQFNWFQEAEYFRDRDVLCIQFHKNLKPFILDLKKAFQLYKISDVSKLQSRYAQRILELVMANHGLAGKGKEGWGKQPGHWYVDLQFDALRQLFKIGPNMYKLKKNLRIKVVDNPVREINAADLGVHITCDYEKFKHGRRLDGVRLLCEDVKKGERIVSPATRVERDEEELVAALITANKELYDKALAEIKAEKEAPDEKQSGLRRIEAMKNIEALADSAAAIEKVKKMLGAQKKPAAKFAKIGS
jgi:plasmid replication initiation protein